MPTKHKALKGLITNGEEDINKRAEGGDEQAHRRAEFDQIEGEVRVDALACVDGEMIGHGGDASFEATQIDGVGDKEKHVADSRQMG
ncbi:hypothetical protein AMTR_s00014p00160370 [Amborella trichopoda]|uniref:Uncharacterized protein n=1 Tax=Amborella trichopoda TaxID=13333 RepID=W1PMV9_AMBTC|nr:hypothetical protein AMTR_s00014p00160370 [Amborella trichopoda]